MMAKDIARNSLLGAIVLSSSLSPIYSNSYSSLPVVQEVRFVETNTVPTFYAINNKQFLYKEACELFGEVRGFSEEESKLYEESLSKLFVSTGDNFFDI